MQNVGDGAGRTMVTIRLSRRGGKKEPFYHVVVTDSRRRGGSGARAGRVLQPGRARRQRRAAARPRAHRSLALGRRAAVGARGAAASRATARPRRPRSRPERGVPARRIPWLRAPEMMPGATWWCSGGSARRSACRAGSRSRPIPTRRRHRRLPAPGRWSGKASRAWWRCWIRSGRAAAIAVQLAGVDTVEAARA